MEPPAYSPTMPPEFDLLTATADTFAPLVGQVFEVVFTDGRLPWTLAEVHPLGPAGQEKNRAPFSLTFHGAPTLRLPQHIYRLEHATLGALEIFVVPIAGDAGASKFEAIFN